MGMSACASSLSVMRASDAPTVAISRPDHVAIFLTLDSHWTVGVTQFFCLWVIKVEGTAPTFEEFAAVTIRNAGCRNCRQYPGCGPRKRELNTSGVSTKSILANRSPSNSNVSHSRSGWLERSRQGHQPLPRRHCPSWPDLCVRTSWGSTESRSAPTRISAGPGTNIDWGSMAQLSPILPRLADRDPPVVRRTPHRFAGVSAGCRHACALSHLVSRCPRGASWEEGRSQGVIQPPRAFSQSGTQQSTETNARPGAGLSCSLGGFRRSESAESIDRTCSRSRSSGAGGHRAERTFLLPVKASQFSRPKFRVRFLTEKRRKARCAA